MRLTSQAIHAAVGPRSSRQPDKTRQFGGGRPSRRALSTAEFDRIRSELDIIARDLQRIGKRVEDAFGRTMAEVIERNRTGVLRSRLALIERYQAASGEKEKSSSAPTTD